jgi:hypothetical protein
LSMAIPAGSPNSPPRRPKAKTNEKYFEIVCLNNFFSENQTTYHIHKQYSF